MLVVVLYCLTCVYLAEKIFCCIPVNMQLYSNVYYWLNLVHIETCGFSLFVMNKNGLYHKIAYHSQKLHKVLRLHSIENKKIIRSNIQKA